MIRSIRGDRRRCFEELIHPVEMALERIHVRRPKLPEGREPSVDFHQRLGADPIHAPLGIHTRDDEARLAQDAEVLRDRGLRHPKPALEVAYRTLRRREQAQNGATVGLSDDGERGLHGFVCTA